MKEIKIERESLDFIEQALADILMGEDDTIVYSANFGNGMEMDFKVCGCSEEPAYTEAVLFRNGYEVACSDCMDDILGVWELEHNGREYAVKVVAK